MFETQLERDLFAALESVLDSMGALSNWSELHGRGIPDEDVDQIVIAYREGEIHDAEEKYVALDLLDRSALFAVLAIAKQAHGQAAPKPELDVPSDFEFLVDQLNHEFTGKSGDELHEAAQLDADGQFWSKRPIGYAMFEALVFAFDRARIQKIRDLCNA